MAEIFLTKQAAAHRLLLSGVIMVNRDDDPLAIHVVAASALNLLRELAAERGEGYAKRAFKEALYGAALAEIEGKASTLHGQHPEMDRAIIQLVEAVRAGQLTSASEIELDMPAGEERRLLDYIIAPLNFLKHAQRDPLATLDESRVRPVEALVHALAAYSMLFPGDAASSEVTAFLVQHGVLESSAP